MKVTIISDTHNKHKDVQITEHTDLLVHCGDFSGYGTKEEAEDFLEWFAAEAAPYKIVVPGNHDIYVSHNFREFNNYAKALDIEILCDKFIEVEDKRIYGTPWTRTFGMWAYMLDDLSISLENKFSQIPENLDLLICHGPPYKILDKARDNTSCGSRSFRNAVMDKKPKNVCFGHIHEAYGFWIENGINFYNAAVLDEWYRPKNKPVIIEI